MCRAREHEINVRQKCTHGHPECTIIKTVHRYLEGLGRLSGFWALGLQSVGTVGWHMVSPFCGDSRSIKYGCHGRLDVGASGFKSLRACGLRVSGFGVRREPQPQQPGRKIRGIRFGVSNYRGHLRLQELRKAWEAMSGLPCQFEKVRHLPTQISSKSSA